MTEMASKTEWSTAEREHQDRLMDAATHVRKTVTHECARLSHAGVPLDEGELLHMVVMTWVNDYVVLVRKAGSTVSVDGVDVIAGWSAVGGYEVARVSVTDGVHTLEGADPFGVVVVGYDTYDSYAYPGGLNQTLINPID